MRTVVDKDVFLADNGFWSVKSLVALKMFRCGADVVLGAARFAELEGCGYGILFYLVY